jgi:hypothetical protein
MIGTGCLEELLKVVGELPRLALGIALSSDDELLIRVAILFVIIALVIASSDRDSLGLSLRPPLLAFGAPLHVVASYLGWCLVVMSRSSFVVFGWSRPSSSTRVRQFMLDENAEMTPVSQILVSL